MEVDEDDDEPIERIKPARARKPVKYDEDESTKSVTEVKASKSKMKIINDDSSVESDIIEDDEEEEEIKVRSKPAAKKKTTTTPPKQLTKSISKTAFKPSQAMQLNQKKKKQKINQKRKWQLTKTTMKTLSINQLKRNRQQPQPSR
jgi:hypothetical protein